MRVGGYLKKNDFTFKKIIFSGEVEGVLKKNYFTFKKIIPVSTLKKIKYLKQNYLTEKKIIWRAVAGGGEAKDTLKQITGPVFAEKSLFF